jgi:sigma-B regulation protein RsbU (phosphoserine phosphatase)
MSIPHLQNSNKEINDLSLIEEISRSVLSILDRESLLNSIITILHQIFGFSRVNIYTTRGNSHGTFRKIGISHDGMDPEITCRFDNDHDLVGWCVSHMEPVIIGDISQDNHFGIAAFDEHAGSLLVTPLLHGNQLIGALELHAENTGTFNAETTRLFQLLAGNIAIAIRNASLYHSEQARRVLSDKLRESLGLFAADRTVDDICPQLLSELEFFLPFDGAAIWLIQPSNDEDGIGKYSSVFRLAGIKAKNPAENMQLQQFTSEIDGAEITERYPWMGDALNQNIAYNSTQAVGNEPIGQALGFEGDYSAIIAPLMVNGHAMGIFLCVDRQIDRYDSESLALVQAFANSASLAIENTRLYSAAHDQAWITTVVLQVAEATQSITNMDELLETIANIIPGLVSASTCAIFLWDASYETFTEKASNGFDDEQSARLKAWDIPPGAVLAFEELKNTRSPVILDSDTISSDVAAVVFPDYDFDRDLLVLFPLLSQNVLCGALLVGFYDSSLDLNTSQEAWDEKYALIQGAAHQAASAIENLQLIKSREEEAYISVALLQVAQAVVSIKQLDEILGTIVRITPILVGVKRCIIYLWDTKDQVFHQSQLFGFSRSDLSDISQVIKGDEFPMIGAIQARDRIIYHPLSAEDSPGTWNAITASDYTVIEGIEPDSDEEVTIKLDERSLTNSQRLLIGFPLSVKGENLGVMLIEEEESHKTLPSVHIRQKRIEIVRGISQQAAIAIKNEQLQREAVRSEQMERELQLAREIQAAFLPDEIPQVSGWDIDARWQPARQVGGDFYDILRINEHKIGLVIADVADKGMPAALFMTLIRTLIRAAANEKTSPAAVLSQVNELLIPDSKQSMFVTVFYCVVDLNNGHTYYANAGHNPPVILRADHSDLVELKRTGIALGLFSNIEMEEQEITLQPDDFMLLYTDGITEAFSIKEEMFGTERLDKLVKEDNFPSSKVLLDRIIDAVNEFIDGMDLSDDVTMVGIHRQVK